MKKATSLFLALVLTFAFNITAYAAEPETTSTIDDGRVYLTEEEARAFLEVQDIEGVIPSDENGMARVTLGPGYVSAGIAEINAYPLFHEIETNTLIYYSDIGTSVTFSSISANNSIRLTCDEAIGLYELALTRLINNNVNGYTYSIAGWYINTLVELRAISPSTPLYVEYRIAEPNFGQGTDYERINVPVSIISCRITGACQFPSNASLTDYFYISGAEGTFWYRAENGKTLGIPFRAGIAINVAS